MQVTYKSLLKNLFKYTIKFETKPPYIIYRVKILAIIVILRHSVIHNKLQSTFKKKQKLQCCN
jgi:hypothetical protein